MNPADNRRSASSVTRDAVPGYALVVDDHPLVARGFAEFLTVHCGFPTVHVARHLAECQDRLASDGPPALAVVDFWLPDGVALPLLRVLRQADPGLRLLVVSGDHDVGVVTKVREAGAHGFLHKQEMPEVFARAVASLMAGDTWYRPTEQTPPPATRRELPIRPADLGLTQRQGEVLGLMLRGQPNKRIALTLNISEQTVKEHVSNILARLGATNRLEAITRLRGRRIEL